jgi:hypothetical protein
MILSIFLSLLCKCVVSAVSLVSIALTVSHVTVLVPLVMEVLLLDLISACVNDTLLDKDSVMKLDPLGFANVNTESLS